MNIIPFGTSTNEEIRDIEDAIGIKLPYDYKEFLLKNNGGKPNVKYSTFNVPDLKQNISLDVLFGIAIEKLDILHWSNLFSDDILPSSLLIGCDMGNGLLVLINDDQNNGIYYWDHSHAFEQSSENNNLFFISYTFTEFLDSLQPL